MEYVILVVGLSAVTAAWDAARRAIESHSTNSMTDAALKELGDRVDKIESSHLVTRNHLSELRNFMNAQVRKR